MVKPTEKKSENMESPKREIMLNVTTGSQSSQDISRNQYIPNPTALSHRINNVAEHTTMNRKLSDTEVMGLHLGQHSTQSCRVSNLEASLPNYAGPTFRHYMRMTDEIFNSWMDQEQEQDTDYSSCVDGTREAPTDVDNVVKLQDLMMTLFFILPSCEEWLSLQY
ncbi:hypothetical protein QTP88_004695 [Uroleucon formosanum]